MHPSSISGSFPRSRPSSARRSTYPKRWRRLTGCSSPMSARSASWPYSTSGAMSSASPRPSASPIDRPLAMAGSWRIGPSTRWYPVGPLAQQPAHDRRRCRPYRIDETAAPYVALGNCLLQLGLTTAIAVPIVLRGQVRGVLLVGFGADADVSPALISMIEDVSRRAGLAIENAGCTCTPGRPSKRAISFCRSPRTSCGRRSPRLPGMRGCFARAGRAEGSGANRSLCRRLDEAGSRLATLAEDLLDVSRIRSGQLPLRVGRVDLGKLAQRVAMRYAEHRSSARDRITLSGR